MAVLEQPFRTGWRRLLYCALAFCLSLGSPGGAAPSKEDQVKAVFLFNFTQFVEWPASSFGQTNSPLVIGILGDDPFGPYLDDTVRGEKVNSHPLLVQRYRNLNDVKECHVLFVSRSLSRQLGSVVPGLKGRHILTVSDIDDFALHGGMIQFGISNGRTRLKINVEAAKAAGLLISSKLLKPAEIVESTSP